MPKFDGTGPKGQGPRTGRGFGNCRGGSGFLRRPNTSVNSGKTDQGGTKETFIGQKKAIEQKLSDLEK